MKILRNHTGLILVFTLLVIHLLIINDYGFTWDFHFHFFGGGHLLGMTWQQLEPRILPYVEPDPRFAWSLPYGAIMSIPPVATYLLFYKHWHLLAQDSSYHLPILLWGIGGILTLYAFLKETINKRVALMGVLFLSTMPRFFSDMHNDMKDVPSATIFAVNVWLIYRLTRYKRLSDLLLAIAGFAVAFNVKINSIFIPIIFAMWIFLTHLSKTKLKTLLHDKKLYLWYFLGAPIAAFLLWCVFWPNPIAQLDHAYRTFAIGTNNIEVLLNGNWYCSGENVPWYYSIWYIAITTPIITLFLFVIGIFTAIQTKNQQLQGLYMLFVLWVFIPLTRYLLPSTGVIDGIRHFEEVLFPLAAFAAIGADQLLSLAKSQFTKRISYGALILMIIWLMFILYAHHPFQITYFNELVGGTHGANGKYDLDYWGGSQKQAVAWVNEHAPKNASVHIVMAADVAGRYLRPDLLTNLNKYGYDESDYVILLNRQSFFYRFAYIFEYVLHHKATHTISVQNTPLVWVYDNHTDNKTPRQTPWWKGEDPCIIKYWKGEKRR